MAFGRVSPFLLISINKIQQKLPYTVDLDNDFLEVNENQFVLRSAIFSENNETNQHFKTIVRESLTQWTELSDQIISNLKRSEAKKHLDKNACLLLFQLVVVNDKKDTNGIVHLYSINDNNDDDDLQVDPQKTKEESRDLFSLYPATLSTKDKCQIQTDTFETCKYIPPSTTHRPPGARRPTNRRLTCYANVIFQTLFSAKNLYQQIVEHCQKGPFHKLLCELFAQMEAASRFSGNKTSTNPNKFMAQFRETKHQFIANQMADSQEFFTILLELIHQEVNKAKKLDKTVKPEEPKTADEAWNFHIEHVDNSYLSTLLMGQMESILTCLNCGHQSRSWSCIWQLQLQIKFETTIEKSIVGKSNAPIMKEVNTTISNDIKETEKQAKEEEKPISLHDCINVYCEEEVSAKSILS